MSSSAERAAVASTLEALRNIHKRVRNKLASFSPSPSLLRFSFSPSVFFFSFFSPLIACLCQLRPGKESFSLIQIHETVVLLGNMKKSNKQQ